MSAQDSCLSLIKYLLFVFNLFFFVLGSLIFCFGIWILVDKTSFVSFVGLSFMPLQIWSKALAISGILTMGLALLGCVGALKELRCLLGLYFGILLHPISLEPSPVAPEFYNLYILLLFFDCSLSKRNQHVIY